MNIDVYIPSDDCVRLISQFVEEMDLTALYGTYKRMPQKTTRLRISCSNS